MPTLPQEGPQPSGIEVHRHRRTAESFGAEAERYDRARPRYPEALVERIVASSPGPDVLDAGCGTGILARQLQAAGCRVLGVDPDARMAGVARRLGVEADTAAFEDWDPAGRRFDAVVAGQAWHWIDPAAGAAQAARVLRPGGLLAPLWNVFRLPPELAEAVAEECRGVLPGSPLNVRALTDGALGGYRPLFARAADGIRAAGGFGAAQRWQVEWEEPCTRDAWLDQMPTQGAFTRLRPDKLARVLEGVGAAVDAMGGSFTMRYTTVAITAPLTGSGTVTP
ncbi:class I SAM-dependent methyltransferase [Streptomyces sp. MUM 178J]|uniref:class I SAM-dependent methyltransferase n=1 Tax=Streptomyces sp. MUM 178J TaxID=2791991 RepID=UPI001F044C19|nr:class I SAM-dependent methyltransferase [Streptomyces sp. MUM 178J]WRQ81322.1 class I SAM-dependent methyltransferase [Streptomyces sp. MUM 178J]